MMRTIRLLQPHKLIQSAKCIHIKTHVNLAPTLSSTFNNSSNINDCTRLSSFPPVSNVFIRCFANKEQRNKDKANMKKKKEKQSASKNKSKSSDTISSLDDEYIELLNSMDQKLEILISQHTQYLSTLNIGRIDPSIIENIRIKLESGEQFPLSELGSITVKTPNSLLIQLYDETHQTAILKCLINNSSKHLDMSCDGSGDIINVTFSKQTKQLKEQIKKDIKQNENEIKVKIRSIRQQYLQNFKSKKIISDEQNQIIKKRIETLTDGSMEDIDEMNKKKLKEIETS